LGNFGELKAHVEYPAYVFSELGNGWQLVLGFGDTDPNLWDGVLSWQLQRDYDTHDYYDGEINNGSPRYVLWSLFEQLEELLKKGAN
jgi:hypothetical protein